jgi:hypothetical protein
MNGAVIRSVPKKTLIASFRQLTRKYFGNEASWEFAVEAFFFAVIAAISAWPIIAAADTLSKFLQRTAI